MISDFVGFLKYFLFGDLSGANAVQIIQGSKIIIQISFNSLSLSHLIYPFFMLIENRACLHDLKQQKGKYLWSPVVFGPLLWLIRGVFYFNPVACACPAKTKSVVAPPGSYRICCFSLSVHTTCTYCCVLVGPSAEEEANPSPIVVVFITLVCINACVFI